MWPLDAVAQGWNCRLAALEVAREALQAHLARKSEAGRMATRPSPEEGFSQEARTLLKASSDPFTSFNPQGKEEHSPRLQDGFQRSWADQGPRGERETLGG